MSDRSRIPGFYRLPMPLRHARLAERFHLDGDELARWAPRLVAALREDPLLRGVTSDLQGEGLALVLPVVVSPSLRDTLKTFKEKLAKARQHLATGLNVREAAARVKIGKTALYQALKADKSAASTIK